MADVQITITIPDAWTTKVLDAFQRTSGKNLRLEAHGPDSHSDWSFTIGPQGPGESAVAFGKRFITQLGKAVVDMVDYADDRDRYSSEISAIQPPQSDVPEGIIT